MADHWRALVAWRHPGHLAADLASNTLYFQKEQIVSPGDYDQVAEDIWELYSQLSWIAGAWLDVRMYNMEDAEPRPIRGQKTATVGGSYTAKAPREVALCLSYHGDRNLPSQRGRIYAGPFNPTGMNDRPTNGHQMELIGLGQGLAGIGGEDISWRVRSVKTGEYHHIRQIWVNNEWDTMRSRGLKATARETASV